MQFFESVYNEHKNYVRRVIYWMIKSDSVDDVVQDTFVKVWRSLEKFDGDSSLKTWIYRIATNSALDHLRKRTWWQIFSSNDATQGKKLHVADPTPSAEFKALSQEMIKKSVNDLPENLKSVFVLFYLEELSVSEISQVIEAPVGTVKSRLHHARTNVRNYLKKEGVKA